MVDPVVYKTSKLVKLFLPMLRVFIVINKSNKIDTKGDSIVPQLYGLTSDRKR